MKTVRKILCLVLTVAALLAVTGCKKKDEINLDLTLLSSTMIYSQVNDMVTNPDKYLGKTVRMRGNFSVYEDEATGAIYFACLIPDATACCSQGIEFVLRDARSYPADYPAVGTEITVEGVFGTYDEAGYTYCYLTDAQMHV